MIRAQPLKPGRPLVAVSSAAVPGTTIHRTSARPTATGTPPTTGTTTTASVSGARFQPEPGRSRSHRARPKRPGPSMMSADAAAYQVGVDAHDHGGACLGRRTGSDRRRWSLGAHSPESIARVAVVVMQPVHVAFSTNFGSRCHTYPLCSSAGGSFESVAGEAGQAASSFSAFGRGIGLAIFSRTVTLGTAQRSARSFIARSGSR